MVPLYQEGADSLLSRPRQGGISVPPLVVRMMASVEAAFRQLETGFTRAIEGSGGAAAEFEIALAGRRVRVRVVGEQLLRQISRPFAHLRRAMKDAPADLRVDLWEAQPLPNAPPVQGSSTQPSEILASHDARWLSQRKPHIWMAFDRDADHIVVRVADSRASTPYEQGRPLHSQLLRWHADIGVPVVHAGMVSLDGDGLLLAGPGGSGKSTVALACAAAGFAYLADDYVGLAQTGDRYIGHSVYCSSHIDAQQVQHFPSAAAAARASGLLTAEGKALLFVTEMSGARLGATAKLAAIVLPRVRGGRTRVVPASQVETMMQLAPTSLHMIPLASFSDGFARLSRLVSTTPAFWLDLGDDFERIPSVLAPLVTARPSCTEA